MSYRLLTLLLWPIFFIYTLKISLRDKSPRYFFQRLGFAYVKQKRSNIWIHCASVGEVNTYFPLHIKCIEEYPHATFIITTNTVTGAHTVIKKISQYDLKQTQHCYLPIESSFAIKRFITAYKPSQCLIMETEIWPLLYQRCNKNNISISIINGRLSQRTLNTHRWVKSLYKNSLSMVKQIICKSQDELNHFLTLGAKPEQCIVGGNLKFTFIDQTQIIQAIKINDRQYVVAASTHDDEELQLATLWKKINTELLLVIIPRHPNRSHQIQKQLNTLNIQYSIRSKKQTVFNDTKIYLADTLGELTSFMQGAEFVFMGGSLIQHGGQNILEPGNGLFEKT